MANEFIARKGLIALNNSQVTGSLNVSGSSFSVDGPSNSHIEVGTYNVGFDTLETNTVLITGSGLIVSGAMADQNHHNMVKIGNVELLDINTLVSSNEFLIHNVSSLKITSGSDGGDIAGTAGRLFEHNGTDFTLYRNNSSVINVDSSNTITFNGTNVSFVATPFFRAAVADPSSNGHFLYTTAAPGSSPQETKAVQTGDVFKSLTGAVTASAVSASSLITDTLSGPSNLTVDVEGDITLDANGADVILKDDGTEFGRFKRDSSDFVIKSATNNKDIVFRGVDDSSTITALTLDMSDAGKALFNSDISSSGDFEFRGRKLSKTSTTDADHQGDVVFFGSTTSMTAGRVYHYNSSGNWELSNATDDTKSTGLLAVALGTASDTNGMLLKGMVTLDHDPGAVGDKLFLRTADGLVNSITASSAGNVIRIVGYCLDASNGQIYFNPSNDFIVRA